LRVVDGGRAAVVGGERRTGGRCVLTCALLCALLCVAALGLTGCAKKLEVPAKPAPLQSVREKPENTGQPDIPLARAPTATAQAARVDEGEGTDGAERDNGAATNATWFEPTGGTFTAMDSPSTSIGTPQEGRLAGGVRLPVEREPGLQALANTSRRDLLWGTVELVRLLVDTSRALAASAVHGDGPHALGEVAAETLGDAVLHVGNLGAEGGGDIVYSHSHNSGRDADVCFFARDREGKAVALARMARFDDAGVAAWPAEVAGQLHFDTARNWQVVRHLLSHPAVVVQWIFISAPLRNMLLDHALRVGEPDVLRERARRVLVQPTDSRPHDDHFHVRIACPSDDRPMCIEGAGRTALARVAQIDALLNMYHRGTPAEQRFARDMLSLPVSGQDLVLLPSGEAHEHNED
jgi:penicillin-insensitive murein DD-endopeptidase